MSYTIQNREQAITELRNLDRQSEAIRSTFGIPSPGKSLYMRVDCGWVYDAVADGFGGATAKRVYMAGEEQELDFNNAHAAVRAIAALYEEKIQSLEDYPDE